PAELGMFVESFRKRISDWDLVEETEVYPLGSGFWVPDFRLIHKASGEEVKLEVLGFWRRSSAIKHLQSLQRHVKERYLIAHTDRCPLAAASERRVADHRDDSPPGFPPPAPVRRAAGAAGLGGEALKYFPGAPPAGGRKLSLGPPYPRVRAAGRSPFEADQQ